MMHSPTPDSAKHAPSLAARFLHGRSRRSQELTTHSAPASTRSSLDEKDPHDVELLPFPETVESVDQQSVDPHHQRATELVQQFAARPHRHSNAQSATSSGVLSNLLQLQRHGKSKRKSRVSELGNLRRPRGNTDNSSPRSPNRRSLVRHNLAELNALLVATRNASPTVSRRSSTEDMAITRRQRANTWGHEERTDEEDEPTGVQTPASMIEVKDAVVDEISAILLKQEYLTLLAKALVIFGAPTHRLERHLNTTSQALHLDAAFTWLPNIFLVSFSDAATQTSHVEILRVEPDFHLANLMVTDAIAQDVADGMMPLEDAAQDLEDLITMRQDYYARHWILLSWLVASFVSAPMFFGGSWLDAVAAGLLGLGIGTMEWLARRTRTGGSENAFIELYELLAAIVCAFVATALRNHLCYSSVLLSAIVTLLPGLSLTTAVMELAARHTITGTVRLLRALITAFILGFGINIGTVLWQLFDKPQPVDAFANSVQGCEVTISAWWNFLMFPLSVIAFSVQLQAAPRQLPSIFLVSSLGFLCSYFTSMAISDGVATAALSAFVIGIVGNAYARLFDQPAITTIVPAVLNLVPGSLGVRGTLALMKQDSASLDLTKASSGVVLSIEMISIAFGITIGLFVASALVWPLGGRKKRAQHLAV